MSEPHLTVQAFEDDSDTGGDVKPRQLETTLASNATSPQKRPPPAFKYVDPAGNQIPAEADNPMLRLLAARSSGPLSAGGHGSSDGEVDEADMPVTPNIETIAPLYGTSSPHRFLTSAALYEEQPRSRRNRLAEKEEEDCVDLDHLSTEATDGGGVPGFTSGSLGMASDARLATTPQTPPQSAILPTNTVAPFAVGGGSVGDSLGGLFGPTQTSFVFTETPSDGADEATRQRHLEMIVRRLRGTQHLSMLRLEELQYLATNMLITQPPKGRVVQDYKSVCTGVYIVLRGRVAVLKPNPNLPGDFISQWWLQRGDMFCFDYVILREHCDRIFKVMSEDTVLGFIDFHVFVHVLRNPQTAISIARKMGEDMQVFQVFKEYARAAFAPLVNAEKVVNWRKVLDKFGKINNGIYPNMHSEELDTGAWTYALRRLPDNITRTLVVELAKAPPPMMASLMRELAAEYDRNPARTPTSKDRITYVGCAVRRRPSYLLGNGKTLVILRDSTTDLLDFLSCMCVHMNESEKLRRHLLNLTDPRLVPNIERWSKECVTVEQTREALKQLPFNEVEAAGLVKLWGTQCFANMFDILTTRRDDLQVRIDLHSYRRYYRTPSTIFASNVRHAILRRLKLPSDGDLPQNIVIDIISSNAHSVKNCLSPYLRRNKEEIFAYGAKVCPNESALEWFNREDLLYYVFSKYLGAHSDARHDFALSWIDAGITVIDQTSMTGLEVDIVDVSAMAAGGVDNYLSEAAFIATERHKNPFAAPHFIINFDYPFGSQAESIMKSLCLAFGSSIRSVNVMGKGGGIAGRRGDVQFPTHLLYSKSSVPYDDFLDELRPCGQEDLSRDMLKGMLEPGREVHEGPVLTIAGTMNQNSKLLRFYKHLWGCVGMEMEGSYFHRALREGIEQQLLRPDIKTRFLYYTSDTPLQSEKESLAAGMTPTEGVPSSYAISRALLDVILRDDTPAPSGQGMH